MAKKQKPNSVLMIMKKAIELGFSLTKIILKQKKNNVQPNLNLKLWNTSNNNIQTIRNKLLQFFIFAFIHVLS